MKPRVIVTFLLATVHFAGCAPEERNQPESAPRGLQPLDLPLSIAARSDTARLFLHVPAEHAEGQLWPTVLFLHGGSLRGADLDRLKAYGPVRLLAEGNRLPFILVAPQLPDGEIWTDVHALIGLIDALAERHPIDLDRVYVTGISMGARGAWYLAYRFPDRIAAIAPVAAFQPIAHWASSGRMCNVAVRAFHGDRDDVAPLTDALRMHEALLAEGGTSEIDVLPGRDHFIADVLHDPRLYDWLLQHRRTPRCAGT